MRQSFSLRNLPARTALAGRDADPGGADTPLPPKLPFALRAVADVQLDRTEGQSDRHYREMRGVEKERRAGIRRLRLSRSPQRH